MYTTLLALALSATAPQEIAWEPHRARTPGSAELEGRLGRIRVPARHGVEGGEELELAFALFETENPEPGPPIYFLVGGPGPSGVEHGAAFASDPRLALLERHDVVCVDQRGTGLSVPNLAEAPDFGYELALERAVTRDEQAAAWRDAMARCCAHWREQGVELAAFNTRESAEDIDLVRRALGHERVILWGTSYGSHLGLAVLRQHPEGVARAVLTKVEGPDDSFKLPSATQRVLARFAALVAADEAWRERLPDPIASLRALLEQLEAEPVVVQTELGGEAVSVAIGPHDLRTLVASSLAATPNLASLPAALHLMEAGEWRHVLGFVARNRRDSVGSAMAIAMDCASGASGERLARIERERADPANLLGDALSAPFFAETCAGCGELALDPAFRAPFDCDVPVLFVSGELDPRTPPENVERLRPGFSNAAHVRATPCGHDDRELESEAYRELVRAFLSGGAVVDTTIELPPIAFRPPPR